MTRHSVGFVATLLVAAAFAPAVAQHSSGNITGDGKAGDVVRVERAETGFVQELKLDADGKYRIPRVPSGIYVVTVTHGDGTVERPREVRVQVGTTARVK
jgi:hypothetical protein